MSSDPEEVKEVEIALEALSNKVNRGLLHEFDKQLVIEEIWGVAQRGKLNVCDIPEVAREKYNWGTHATDFLKWTVNVIEVLYPMAQKGRIKLTTK